MLEKYLNHNRFIDGTKEFTRLDPQLSALSRLHYQYKFNWWQQLDLDKSGIYILTGGRQVGKSTSCKQLIKYCLDKKRLSAKEIFYLPCDEIYDAIELGKILRFFLNEITSKHFLLIVDEITFVKNWDRVIKALADEGCFNRGICLLTGSDTLILKEAAMRFPGRRGTASKTDFHIYPLSFKEYVQLKADKTATNNNNLFSFFQEYLLCGGYLRAINDLAEYGEISQATFMTYEQWIRGDILKHGKHENMLLAILRTLFTLGVSQISYSGLTQKIGLVSKETCIDYCRILQRMDILITLQAFDQNKKQGFPRKAQKFHFTDPFIYHTLHNWLMREGYLNRFETQNILAEACVASHCNRLGKTFYFKGQGEIDVIRFIDNKNIQAIEVKWSEQLRPSDLKMLKLFKNSLILTKTTTMGTIEHIKIVPLYRFLYQN